MVGVSSSASQRNDACAMWIAPSVALSLSTLSGSSSSLMRNVRSRFMDTLVWKSRK